MCMCSVLCNVCTMLLLLSVLTSSQCQTVACALSLLPSIPLHHSPSLLIEQLIYLVQGHSYLCEATPSLPCLPSCPSCVPQELWTHLHTIPLSTVYFPCVVSSAHNDRDTEFWEGLKQGKGQIIEDFPWKVDRKELLLLNLIHEPSVLPTVSRNTARLASSVKALSLSELLTTSDREKRNPLLLLHNENQIVCEYNLFCLQKELQNIIGVSTHLLLTYIGPHLQTASDRPVYTFPTLLTLFVSGQDAKIGECC